MFGSAFDPSTAEAEPDSTSISQFYKYLILAGAPQVLLSVTYVIYNNYLTCMVAAREYGRFAQAATREQLPSMKQEKVGSTTTKQALRVSQEPRGEQKAQPFLTPAD